MLKPHNFSIGWNKWGNVTSGKERKMKLTKQNWSVLVLEDLRIVECLLTPPECKYSSQDMMCVNLVNCMKGQSELIQ